MRLQRLDQELTAMQCTPEEKKAIHCLANQATFGIIMQNTKADPGAMLPLCPAAASQRTEYVVSRESAVIHLNASCAQDIAGEKDEKQRAALKDVIRENDYLCKSLEMKIDIAIDAQGKAAIRSLGYFVNKGPGADQ